ncbi:MAG: hypothetical protein O2967_17750 [Proteobacteria bacterium]|nr:hypothetical protein [Pseudomonadota bacterium]
MAFGLSEIGTLIGIGAKVFGAVKSADAAHDQEQAFESQAAFSLEGGAAQARAAEELAAIEAALLERQGLSAREIAQANAAMAEQNAVWEEQAGLAALSQARHMGEARVSSMVTGFASQGRLIDGTTPNLLIEEGFAELAKDLEIIQLNTESRAARERSQADLFTLQGQRELELSQARAASRRRVGQIDADSLRRTGQIEAATSLTNAAGARTRATGALVGGLADFGIGVARFADNYREVS